MEASEENYYELLGLEITASAKDIRNAYRRKALKYHPDKNPSPDAAIMFDKLSKAQELLLDPSKRSDYDQRHRARLERQKKKQEMDSKRRHAQEELEKREREAKKMKTEQEQAKAQYESELARLREEGAKRRQEDWSTETKPEVTELSGENELGALKIKWKRKRYNFTEQDLRDIFNPIAEVDSLALSEKKKGSAILILKTVVDAYGIITKKDTHPSLAPFESINWATGRPPSLVEKMIRAEEMQKEARAAIYGTTSRTPSSAESKPLFATGSQSFFKNFSIPINKVSP
ncbi:hypothetical protein BDF20DRAFT_907003 [Mycotypha africana]|uniref:uncharacterized protein n=1 Tax=Mycotypha africana TaxID=64632 RepID=UPI0023006446|nr:uncharacterized protein BDF20DRAFT_907003 [Mycotypha africana]KAI8973363.1 hypothetical protein BDF20DRAFT_907003 [Mycotypha africana]